MFNDDVLLAFGVCIAAAAATMIGALSIFSAQKDNARLLSFGLAFAGGAMVYISLVEIFWKAHTDFSSIFDDKTAYTYATFAFFAGVLLIATIDRLIPNPHNALTVEGNDKTALKRVGLMAALAITVHNFPEGAATFFATLEEPAVGSSLAFAIAVHNIPEGVSIAIPVYYATQCKKTAVLACGISAIAEPIGALIGYLVLAPFLSPFAFAIIFGVIAGVMVFLALDELLPTAKRYSTGHDTVYGIVIGMACIALSLILFR
ncbi:MAG: zinc transporter ZupT [Alphaproteobacteria bacterium]